MALQVLTKKTLRARKNAATSRRVGRHEHYSQTLWSIAGSMRSLVRCGSSRVACRRGAAEAEEPACVEPRGYVLQAGGERGHAVLVEIQLTLIWRSGLPQPTDNASPIEPSSTPR
jgi:hypothetical protein